MTNRLISVALIGANLGVAVVMVAFGEASFVLLNCMGACVSVVGLRYSKPLGSA